MLKVVVILLVVVLLFRWALGFWPWALAKGPNRAAQKLNSARRTLGVSRAADRTEILAAHKLLLTRVHPDRGGTNEQVHKANDARDLLLAELGEGPAITTSPPEDSGSQE